MTNTEKKERTVCIPLTDEQAQRLAEIAAAQGMSIGELLGAFTADLTGINENGSDERQLACDWLYRCAFDLTAPESFVRYLAEGGQLRRAADDITMIRTLQREFTEEGIDTAGENCRWIAAAGSDLRHMFSDYCDTASNPETMADAFSAVREYAEQIDALLGR